MAEAGGGVTLTLSLGLPDITIGKTRDNSGVPDVGVQVSTAPDVPPTEAVLQDVSCPASIIEI